MTIERVKDIQSETAYPDSISVQQALLQVWNECEQEQLRIANVSGCHSFRIGDIVYHRSVYEHKEPLKVVGIAEDKLLLEGDYSGGTHNVVQRDWLPIKGTSRIRNHTFKLKAREDAIVIETLAIPCADSQDNTHKAMMDMAHAVMVLTSDVSLNPEF